MADEGGIIGHGRSFPPSFSRETRGVEMRRGVADIEEGLEIIFSTSFGERFMRPRFGCNLAGHVFDPLNAGQLAYIETLVATAVLYHDRALVRKSGSS